MTPDLTGLIQTAVESAAHELGNTNVLVAGRTGAGKSTLVNAVLKIELAATGQGAPVTMETRAYSKPGLPVTIFDTRGLELTCCQEIIDGLEQEVIRRQREDDPRRRIHVAWLCVMEDNRRVEDAEKELAAMLGRHGVPVIGVITKARTDDGFRVEVQRQLPSLSNVVRVFAKAERSDDGHVRPVMGLEDLVELTLGALPEDQRNAFVAAQKINLELKAQAARKHVVVAAGLAMAAAATPIALVDSVAIVPIEVMMLARISAVFGLQLNAALLGTLLTGSLSGAAASFGRKALVGELLKLMPGAGTLAGAAVGAMAAAAFTTACGEAYIRALRLILLKGHDTAPSPKEVGRAFRLELRRGESGSGGGGGGGWLQRLRQLGRRRSGADQ